MMDRLRDLKTTAAGLVAAVITIVAFAGIDLSAYKETIVALLGTIATVIGLFSKSA